MSTYVLDGVLCEDADVLLCRAHTPEGRRVLLRSLRGGRSTRLDLEWLRHEQESARLAGSDVTPVAEGLGEVDGRPALVLRDDGVESLACIAAPLELPRVIALALALTEALARAHSRRLVHGNLRPSSVLITPGGAVELIGFRDAAMRAGSRARPAPGMWPYLSPEQTGRPGLPVDHRSDLYSLGVLLFQLLIGRLPFRADDLLGWIHGHCAVAPPSPADLAPGVPEVLSDAVLKLLAKQPEDRYQSAHGLRHDLDRIRAALASGPSAERFVLGAGDARPPLRLAGKLFGREQELATIEHALDRVTADAGARIVIVRGPGGIGKSALLERLVDEATRRALPVGAAAFEPMERDVPHGGLLRALDRAVAQAVDASADRVGELASRVRSALGINVSLLADRVPALRLLVPETEAPVEVPPREAERRFLVAIGELVGALASPGAPVVLVIDDLQWADAGAIELITRLPESIASHPVLLVFAHRDVELPEGHPLRELPGGWKEQGHPIELLTLAPLSVAAATRWIADGLRARPEDVEPLAGIVHARSGGSPFAISQMMRALDDEGLISYSSTERAWSWDLDAIRARRYADAAAADVVAARLRTLSPAACDALRLFASHGGSAHLLVLAVVLGCAEDAVVDRFVEALDAGLVVRIGPELRFLHDRIQLAAYALTPATQRAPTHLAIARALLARLSPEQVQARVFEVVPHLIEAAPLIESSGERTRAAEICALAGRRAQAASDPPSAIRFFRTARSLLSEASWETDYELTFMVHFELKRSRFASGEATAAEPLWAMLRTHARTEEHAAATDALLADFQISKGELHDAIATCLRALRTLGTELPDHPSAAALDDAYRVSLERLGADPAGTITALPRASSTRARLASDLLSTVRPAAALREENLTWYAACASVDLAVAHGNTASSVSGYAVLAGGLAIVYQRYREAAALGSAAYWLACRDENLAYRSRASFEYLMMSACLALPARECAELAEREKQVAVALGDVTFASYFSAESTIVEIHAGTLLDDLASSIAERLAFVERAGMLLVRDWIARQALSIACLQGRVTLDELIAAGKPRDAWAPGEHFGQAVIALRASYLLGNLERARHAAAEAHATGRFALSLVEVAAYHFFAALTLARGDEPADERVAMLAIHHAPLRGMAECSPQNFGAQASLVAAEIARLSGDELAAEHAYERAIRDARRHGLAHVEAIANERAAEFQRARGFETLADAYLTQARDGFEAWGARAKVAALTRAHPQLAQPGVAAGWAETLDVQGILKASQAISSTLDLSELRARLLAVVIEHAGAQRGCLLSRAGTDLVLAAAGGADPAGFGPIDHAANAARLPLSLCRTVARTRRPVVIADATAPHRFDFDPYFVAARPKSVLCIPIVREEVLVGVLYLENDLMPGAFTRVRLSVVEMLAAQAGISLENARLFSEAREENAQRRRAEASLAESRSRLRSIIDNTTAVIFVKDLEGRYLLVNRRFDELFHIRSDEIAGKTDLEIFVREQAQRMRETDRKVLEAEHAIEFDEAIAQDDGVHEYVALKFPLRLSDGTIYAVCGIATDVTARNRLLAAERQARAEAEDAVRLRDEFLSVASHELRTPLTSLTLAVQALDPAIWSSGKVEQAQSLVHSATRQTRRLAWLVGMLLDVSQLRTGKLELRRSETDLRRVVAEVSALLAHDLARSGSTLAVRGPDPLLGVWDEPRLEQVVTNLVSNAIKFGRGQPIELTLGLADAGRVATLSVEDHGPGIPAEIQPRLFEAFQRGVSARHYGGLGLGLYISRAIVDSHGGRIRVESAVGQGARFVVELPRSLEGSVQAFDHDTQPAPAG